MKSIVITRILNALFGVTVVREQISKVWAYRNDNPFCIVIQGENWKLSFEFDGSWNIVAGLCPPEALKFDIDNVPERVQRDMDNLWNRIELSGVQIWENK